MFEDCGKKGWSIQDIDDKCLYIGAFDINIPLKEAYHAFNGWMKEMDIKYPITNFQSTFKCPLCKPPFLTGVDKMNLLDITLGKKIILACLDFDKWFEIGDSMGLNCEWLTQRESDKCVKENKGIDFYRQNKKIIKVSFDGWTSFMGDAVPARIFFEFLRPASAMRLSKELCMQMAGEINQSEPQGSS
jgi:hypothetical protein